MGLPNEFKQLQKRWGIPPTLFIYLRGLSILIGFVAVVLSLVVGVDRTLALWERDNPVVFLRKVSLGDGSPGEKVPLFLDVDYLRPCPLTVFAITAIDSAGRKKSIRNNRKEFDLGIGEHRMLEFSAWLPRDIAPGKADMERVQVSHVCAGVVIGSEAMEVESFWVEARPAEAVPPRSKIEQEKSND